LKLQPINFHQKGYAMSDENFEQVFQVTGPARLEVSNIRGSVEIRPGAEGVITVKAEKLVNTGDANQTEIEMTQEADGSVKVKTRFSDFWLGWIFGSKPCEVNYIISAPRACALQVNGVSNDLFAEGFKGDATFKTVSGDMTVRALNGSLSFDSVSGDLQLSDLTGNLRLNTVSGDITGTHLSGTVSLNTVSGDFEVEQSSLPSVSATTVSGEIGLETGLGDGPYKFNSVSGDLTLKVPADTCCTAELHTLSGDLSVKLPVASVLRHNGTQTTEIQGGGVKVYLNSVSGDMKIKS
jgi:DUF4097 and DUF4098 domain-containing protein YvlB